MFSRRILRTKAMKHLYAFLIQEKATSTTKTNNQTIIKEQYKAQDLQNLKNSLTTETQKIKNILFDFLQLLVAWTHLDQERADTLLPPRKTTLAQNNFLKSLQQNATFIHLSKIYPSTIPDHLIEEWYDTCLKPHSSFLAYTQPTNDQPRQDIALVNTLIKKIILKHKAIQQYTSRQDINWQENKLIVRRLLLRLIENFLQDPTESFALYTKELPIKGADFYEKLISKTIEKEHVYQKHIAEKLQNWELKRVTLLDNLLIKMALTEVLYFENIPPSVSINEYLEISKQYSTQKSYQFINGVLQPLITELTSEQIPQRTNFFSSVKTT